MSVEPKYDAPESVGAGIGPQQSKGKIRAEHDFERIIMGIDPGTHVMGYGVLGINGKNPKVIVMGVIQLSKFESHYLRLSRIFERVTGLVEQYLPDELAIEAPFFGKNVQSMLKLGRAQGVAMAAALSRDIPIHEYAFHERLHPFGLRPRTHVSCRRPKMESGGNGRLLCDG